MSLDVAGRTHQSQIACVICGQPARPPHRSLCSPPCRASAARELAANREREALLRRRIHRWYRQPTWRHWLLPSREQDAYRWAAELDELATRSDLLAAALEAPDRRPSHGPHLLHRHEESRSGDRAAAAGPRRTGLSGHA